MELSSISTLFLGKQCFACTTACNHAPLRHHHIKFHTFNLKSFDVVFSFCSSGVKQPRGAFGQGDGRWGASRVCVRAYECVCMCFDQVCVIM